MSLRPPSPVVGFVIPTRNRPHFLKRALESLEPYRHECEIVVVDDASDTPEATAPATSRASIRTLRLPENLGPGAARDRGIEASRARFIVMMDDDDLFVMESWNGFLRALEDTANRQPGAPLYFFATSSSRLPEEPAVLSEHHLISGSSIGECKPVINASAWREAGLQYPETRIGGEGLLWLEIAQRFGIPSRNIVLTEYLTDAPERLTSVEQQLKNAHEHALLQRRYLELYETHGWDRRFPAEYGIRQKAAITYSLLAGDAKAAREFALRLRGTGFPGRLRRVFWIIASFLPLTVLIAGFRVYRSYGELRRKL